MKSIFDSNNLFSRIMNKVGDMILLSILWVVCSIPLITIGASTSAAYYVAAKVIRHNSGYVWKSFFKSFKLNFKASIGMTVLFIFLAVLLLFNLIYVKGESTELDFYLRCVYMGIAFVFLGVYAYAFAVLSRFDIKGGRILMMSFQLVFRHFISTAALVALFILVSVGIYLMPWAVLIFPGVMLFIDTFLMERVLLKYMPKPEEDSEEAESWYYQ